MSDEAFTAAAKPFLPEWMDTSHPTYIRSLPILREKISTFGEIKDLFTPEGELSFMQNIAVYPKELLLWKKNPDATVSHAHLTEVKKLLSSVSENDFTAEHIKAAIWADAEEKGKGDVLWPLRVAITGKERSPDPFISGAVIGKNETLARIDSALHNLSSVQ